MKVQKTDETNFSFQLDVWAPDHKSPAFSVEEDRVFDIPKKKRSIKIGPETTRSIAICIHSRLVTHPCPTCEYEAPRISGVVG